MVLLTFCNAASFVSAVNSIPWWIKVLLSFLCVSAAIPRAITDRPPPFGPLGPEALPPLSRSELLEISDGCASGALGGRWCPGPHTLWLLLTVRGEDVSRQVQALMGVDKQRKDYKKQDKN